MALTAARWQAFWEWPLMVGAVTFLGVYSWQVLGDVKGLASEVAAVVITVTWAMFAVDYVGRLVLADDRWRWFYRHLLDLAIVVLPALRPLRLLRLVVLLAIFQRIAGRTLRGQVVVYVAGTTLILIFVGSLAVFDAERHEPNATITSFGDAVWWACSTITTVGYGDMAPVSLAGRCIAVAVMVGGIALLGTVTATLASWIVQRVAEEVAEEDEANQAATRKQVEVLTGQLAEMRRERRALARRTSPATHRVAPGVSRRTVRASSKPSPRRAPTAR